MQVFSSRFAVRESDKWGEFDADKGLSLQVGVSPSADCVEEIPGSGPYTAMCDSQETYKFESVVMVGDGATDLEARSEGAASLFIG